MASELLKLYSDNSRIARALELACEQERELADGLHLSDDILLQGILAEDSGLWQICFKVPHGEVLFLALDEGFTQIRIISIPSADMVVGAASMDEDDVRMVQYKNSRSMDVDMTDVLSLKAAKVYFAHDYVMSNIHLNDEDSVATMLIRYLRNYRKLYTDFTKTFSFLWQNTPYTSALALRRALERD